MNSYTVALIEDEPGVRSVIREILEAEGFRVFAVSDSEGLNKVVGQVRPQLFVVDVMLPHSNGVMLATKLRHAGFGQTPMIAISASPLLSRFAIESGVFQDALDKPFDREVLVERVTRLVA